LWQALRENLPQARFRRQVPCGPYFADFASHGAKLIIELDGGHHADAQEYDAARTAFLNGEGYRVIRFWNNDVLMNTEGVLTLINKALSPCGRGLGEGPAASAAEKTLAPEFESFGSQTRAAPHPIPLPQGERGSLSNL
jgi:very-short-patch-repair endonuclease